MDSKKIETVLNPRKSPNEVVGDHNCSFCNDYHFCLVQLPGTRLLVCKSCLAALDGAINQAYIRHFKESSQPG